MGCRLRELKEKSVISVCDGRCLGNICDLEIEPRCGKIESIYVPGFIGGFFSRSDDIRIPWESINQIGEDAILVDVDVSQSDCSSCPAGKKKRWFF